MTSIHFVRKKNVVILYVAWAQELIFYSKNRMWIVVRKLEEVSRLHFGIFDNLKILVLLLHSSVPVYIL